MLEISRKEPCSCSFVAGYRHLGTMGWSDFQDGISNTKRRLWVLHAAVCWSFILTKEFRSPTLLTRGVSLYHGNLASGKTVLGPTCVCKERSQVQYMRAQSIVYMGIRSIWQRKSCQRDQVSGHYQAKFTAARESICHCRRKTCCSNLRLQGAIASSTHASSIDRQHGYQIHLATK